MVKRKKYIGLVIRALDHVYFWATHQGAEIDLVFSKGGRMFGIEIKRADAPDQVKQLILNVLTLKIGRFCCLNDVFESKKSI